MWYFREMYHINFPSFPLYRAGYFCLTEIIRPASALKAPADCHPGPLIRGAVTP